MTDAMKVAQQRRLNYKKDIANMEKEIAELHELIADLDSFLEFGEALLTNTSTDDASASTPDSASTPSAAATPSLTSTSNSASAAKDTKPADTSGPSPKRPAPAVDTDDQITAILAQRAGQ